MHDHIARTLAAGGRPESVVAGHLLAVGDSLRAWTRADRADERRGHAHREA